MRHVAVINQKDGVGKTTITTNLGHALTLSGYRVTVIDLDPRGQLAASLGLFRAPSKGLDRVLLEGADLDSVQVSARDLLTLIPAGMQLEKMEVQQEGGASRARRLQQSLNGKLRGQDFILYDCPSSFGILVANAIFAADEVIIPLSGDYPSLNGLARMIASLKKFEPFLQGSLKRWIVQSRFIPRRRLSKEVQEKLLSHVSGQVLATPICEASVVAGCLGAGRTIFEYRQSSRSANEFAALAQDLIERRTM